MLKHTSSPSTINVHPLYLCMPTHMCPSLLVSSHPYAALHPCAPPNLNMPLCPYTPNFSFSNHTKFLSPTSMCALHLYAPFCPYMPKISFQKHFRFITTFLPSTYIDPIAHMCPSFPSKIILSSSPYPFLHMYAHLCQYVSPPYLYAPINVHLPTCVRLLICVCPLIYMHPSFPSQIIPSFLSYSFLHMCASLPICASTLLVHAPHSYKPTHIRPPPMRASLPICT